MRLPAWLIIISVALCLAVLPVRAEKRAALVIGNAAYRDAPLKNPVNDARAMAAKLKDLGFRVVQRENTTKLEMERAVADFGDLLDADTVGLVFYAGHGLQIDGRNYLVPIDARIASQTRVRLEAVDVDVLLEQMGAAGSRVNIVILDACRNNPFERRFRSYEGGLAQINAPQGTLIAYATAPGKTAADGTGAHGLYTSELLRALDLPGLPVEEVFKRVRVQVSRASGGAQTPWEASSLIGSFSFREAAPVASPGAPTSVDRELMFWSSIQASDDPAMFDAYLRQFPNGTFAELARTKAAALRQPKSVPAVPPVVAPAPAPASSQVALVPPPPTSDDFLRPAPQAKFDLPAAPAQPQVDIAALYAQREIKGTYVVTSKVCGISHKLRSSKRIEFGARGTTPFKATFTGDGFTGPVQIDHIPGGLRVSISAHTVGAVTLAQSDGFGFSFYVPQSDIAADGSFVARHDVNSFHASRCTDYGVEFTAR